MVRQRRSRTPNFVPWVAACATKAGELTERLYEGLSVGALTIESSGPNLSPSSDGSARSQLADEALRTLVQFSQTDYEMPLSYDPIMEAYNSIVHSQQVPVERVA